MHRICSALLLFFASLAAFAQSAAPKAEFEVASVKPAGDTPPQQMAVGVHIDGAQVNCNYLSLKDYIRMAYRVKIYQVVGPDWMASTRFDISAKLPAGASRDQVPDMLKSLLAERFQLKSHLDSKEFPVYGLTVGKNGLKIKESPLEGEAGTGTAPVNVTASGGPGGVSMSFGRGSYFNFGNNRLEARKIDMRNFTATLERFVDRPVVDMTDLKGNYDFTIEFTPEDYRAMLIRSALSAGVTLPPGAERLLEGVSGDSLFQGLQTLGLKLEPRKAPLEVLVVDQANKIPTEN